MAFQMGGHGALGLWHMSRSSTLPPRIKTTTKELELVIGDKKVFS